MKQWKGSMEYVDYAAVGDTDGNDGRHYTVAHCQDHQNEKVPEDGNSLQEYEVHMAQFLRQLR